MADALASLPWVEPTGILPNRTTRQVKVTLKDRSQFDFEKLKEVVSEAGYPGARLLAGPTDS